YVSHLQGIDIRRQEGGGLACQLSLGDVSSGIGLVDVLDRTIYALSGDGWVYAMRHPPVKLNKDKISTPSAEVRIPNTGYRSRQIELRRRYSSGPARQYASGLLRKVLAVLGG